MNAITIRSFRLFALVAAVSLGLSGPASAQAPQSRWQYSAVIPEGPIVGTFAAQGNGRWIETVSNGAVFHFVETYRDQNVTEIHDSSRDVTVRLGTQECLIRHSGTNGQFVFLYRGGWAFEPIRSIDANIAGVWQANMGTLGSSQWIVTSLGGNRYRVQEQGLGHATGIATVTGNRVLITWSTGGYNGTIDVTLDPSLTTARGVNTLTSGRPGVFPMSFDLVSR